MKCSVKCDANNYLFIIINILKSCSKYKTSPYTETVGVYIETLTKGLCMYIQIKEVPMGLNVHFNIILRTIVNLNLISFSI